MCGICGIVDLNNSPPIRADELKAMCKTIEHRGPDGTRTMIRNSIAFGHTRLSIIDTVTGWQPIANEDNSMFVILNGEIYNFQELRKELIGLGHQFSTTSDTEVVIHQPVAADGLEEVLDPLPFFEGPGECCAEDADVRTGRGR